MHGIVAMEMGQATEKLKQHKYWSGKREDTDTFATFKNASKLV